MTHIKPSETVAKRELLFSLKGESTRHRMVVRVRLPFEVQPTNVSFEISPGTACCQVEFDGLDEPACEVFGADTLQALALAVDIDPVLRGLSKKYDFFFDTGECYFDDEAMESE